MDVPRVSGILLILGSVLLVLTFVMGVPGFYQTQDTAERVRLVNKHRTRWNLTIALNMVLFLLPAIGLLFYSVYLWRSTGTILAVLGASVYALGAIAFVIHEYVRSTDLVGYFEGGYPDYHGIGNWFVMAGLLLLGVSFLQAGLTTWLSYLTIGLPIALAVIWLFAPGFFFAIPFFAIALLLVIGIFLFRS